MSIFPEFEIEEVLINGYLNYILRCSNIFLKDSPATEPKYSLPFNSNNSTNKIQQFHKFIT